MHYILLFDVIKLAMIMRCHLRLKIPPNFLQLFIRTICVIISIHNGNCIKVKFCSEQIHHVSTRLCTATTGTWTTNTTQAAQDFYEMDTTRKVENYLNYLCVGVGEPIKFECFGLIFGDKNSNSIYQRVLSWDGWPKGHARTVANSVMRVMDKIMKLAKNPGAYVYNLITGGYLRKVQDELSVSVPDHLNQYMENFVYFQDSRMYGYTEHATKYASYLDLLDTVNEDSKMSDMKNLAFCFRATSEYMQSGNCGLLDNWTDNIDTLAEIYYNAAMEIWQEDLQLCYGSWWKTKFMHVTGCFLFPDSCRESVFEYVGEMIEDEEIIARQRERIDGLFRRVPEYFAEKLIEDDVSMELFCVQPIGMFLCEYRSHWSQLIPKISAEFAIFSSIGTRTELCYGLITSSDHSCFVDCAKRENECSVAVHEYMSRKLGRRSEVVDLLVESLVTENLVCTIIYEIDNMTVTQTTNGTGYTHGNGTSVVPDYLRSLIS
eukprot:570935_1